MKSLWSTGAATFAGEHYTITGAVGAPLPHSRPYPQVIIGGGGERVLGIAAREADIVGVNPSLAAGYVGPEVLATTTAEYYDQRIGWIREAAGDRFDRLELQVLTFLVQIVPGPRRCHRASGRHDGGHRRADRRVAHRAHRHRSSRSSSGSSSGASASGSPMWWCTRPRWRRSPRWWRLWPAPEVGSASTAHRHLRRDLRPDPPRARPGGRGGQAIAAARPAAGGGGQRALAEAGPAGHPGRGPLRHGRRGAGRPARARGVPGGARPGRAVLHGRHRARSCSQRSRVPSSSWWSGADVVAGLDTWHEERGTPRAGDPGRGRPARRPRSAPPSGWRAVRVPVEPVDVSSTGLRTRLEPGGSVVGDRS